MISLRVGTVLSYGLLIGILAWLTMASIASIDQVNTSLKLVNEVNGVKQRHAINFRGSVHDRSILIRDVILAPDAADRAESIRGIETLRAFYDASAGPMDALFEDAIPDSAEERDILSRIKAVQARTVPLVDRAIALSLAGESEAAEALLMAEIRPAFADWLAVINEMIDHQEGLNRDIGTDVAARVENFAGQSYGLLALGAGLAVLLLGLTLWSLHPLSRLERALAQVAQGNYDVTIGRGGVTEVRKLRASATAMLESLRAGREAETLVALAEELRGVLHRVRAGDLTARLETEVHDGTALDLRDGTNALIESMATGLEATMSFLSQLAAGDLTARMQGASTGAFKAVERDANKAAQSLEALLFTLVEGSAAQEARTADLTDKMGRLSHEAQTSAATLEETVAALEELAGSVKASSENATEADRFLQTARQTSDDSTHVVREAVEAMDKILSASEEISQIIKLIDDIAFQTNLLALNSGVEAARAGDAGRGFAVVAQEVRALAQRSADAAAEIKRLIDASARHVETGVHLVDKAGKSILSVNGAIGEIAGQVNQIATATHEQARNIALLNASANDLDRSTQTNAETLAQAVEELARVAGTATETAQRAGRFRVGSEREAEPQNRRAA